MQLVTSYIVNDIIWVSCSSKVITAVLSSKHCGEFVIGLTPNVTENEKREITILNVMTEMLASLLLSVQMNKRKQMIHFCWLFFFFLPDLVTGKLAARNTKQNRATTTKINPAH